MQLWICNRCGAEVKQVSVPEFCPMCKKKGDFDKGVLKELSEIEKQEVDLFEKTLEMLESYEEGCPPVTQMEGCGCCVGDNPHPHSH